MFNLTNVEIEGKKKVSKSIIEDKKKTKLPSSRNN